MCRKYKYYFEFYPGKIVPMPYDTDVSTFLCDTLKIDHLDYHMLLIGYFPFKGNDHAVAAFRISFKSSSDTFMYYVCKPYVSRYDLPDIVRGFDL